MKEEVITLDKFKPREYQIPLINALEKDGFRRIIAVMPRRSGKDITAFNIAIRQCLKKVGTVFYVFPTFSQGRRILWDAIQNDGMRILDYIPRELVESRNEQQMRIRFVNGSVLQIIGSDNYDNTLVGTNPMGVIFSEFALTDPRAYQFVRPILTANGGWCFIQSTPRGRNSFWELFKIAQDNPNSWFSYMKTVDDTKHISVDEIRKEIDSGEISEDLAMQEYWCSFDMGVEGSYYAKYIDKMRLEGRIDYVAWEPAYPVNTAWDIGVRDSTSIVFFQSIGTSIRIIDYYEKSKEGLEHYVKVVKDKPYLYGKHIAPHDIAVKEFGSGMTRIEKAMNLGIDFIISSKLSIEDGIEAVRSNLPKIFIDKNKCDRVIKSLENYRQEFDAKKKIYKQTPLHNEFSHCADAIRYMCVSLSKVKDGMSSEDVRRMVNEASHGSQSNMPSVFQGNHSSPHNWNMR